MRTMIVAGNWKLNLVSESAVELAGKVVKSAGGDGPEVLLCPSFTLLHTVCEVIAGSRVKLGAQNLFWESKGAFTGEISAEMLLDIGCSHVIIGHSERRQYFGETDASVRRKTQSALLAGLKPVVCVGETLDEREEGSSKAVVEHQVNGALERFKPEDLSNIVIAYEPIWAIGTGKTATPETAQQMHKMIRKLIGNMFGSEISDGIPILYGGSVKGNNATDLFSQPDIDGGLVGGASLDAESFAQIIDAARREPAGD